MNLVIANLGSGSPIPTCLILSGTASRQVASSGGGMWRQLPVRDDIGDATEPKLARPAAVEGGPTQRTA